MPVRPASLSFSALVSLSPLTSLVFVIHIHLFFWSHCFPHGFLSVFEELLKCASPALSGFSAARILLSAFNVDFISVAGFHSLYSAFRQTVSFGGFLIFYYKFKADISLNFPVFYSSLFPEACFCCFALRTDKRSP